MDKSAILLFRHTVVVILKRKPVVLGETNFELLKLKLFKLNYLTFIIKRKKIKGFGPNSSYAFEWTQGSIKTTITVKDYLKKHYGIILKYFIYKVYLLLMLSL